MKPRIAVSAVLTVAIFLVDAVYIVSPAFSVIYIAPLLIIANSGMKRLVVPWACVCVLLTLAAFMLGLPISLGPIPVANLMIGLMAIIVTAVELVRSDQMSAALAREGKRYRDVFNNVAMAIWEHDLRPMQEAVRSIKAMGVVDVRAYLEENPQVVARTRRAIRITDVNAQGLALMKVANKEDFFRNLDDCLTQDDVSFANCMVAMAEGRPRFQEQCQLRTASGELIDIIVAFGLGSGEPLDRVAASILDITEQVRLARLITANRDSMAKVEQAAALGQMSASIAHELEQPLTAIQSSLAAAMRWQKQGSSAAQDMREALEIVGDSARRARTVIQRIRALVGKSQTQSRPLALDAFLLEATTFLQADILSHGARLSRSLQSGIIVDGDEVLLQQVVTNLVRNALQAMSATPPAGRRISIETGMREGLALIWVADTGPGWPPDILASAFQAFRSTKVGGMGLGLSICRTIVEAHKGQIRLTNGEEGGALVEIALPICQVAAQAPLEPVPV